MNTVLIIDDDDQLRTSFEKLLTDEGYGVKSTVSGEEGLGIIQNAPPDVVVLDIRLPGMNGLETFQKIHETDSKLPVIMMTAYSTTETAIEATKIGAFDYILKPFDIPEMLEVISKAIEASRFMRTPIDFDVIPGKTSHEAIIGNSKPMQDIYKAIGRVSATDTTVLIRGDSGTGKELVARAVYQHSNRADKPFIVINCVAIPENLLESELFGYEKGAFTGAAYRRIGKIEQADGGTVFLDEIGDMPLSIQAKILRLLQEKSIERLGGEKIIRVDVRIIAATNRNLEEAIEKECFREDLYYRLKVVTITLPSLCARSGDILTLIEYFLARQATELGIVNPGITKQAVEILEGYSWPGNVRELTNIIQKLLIFNRGAPVSREETLKVFDDQSTKAGGDRDNVDQKIREWIRMTLATERKDNLFDSYIDHFATILVSEALTATEGNRSKAAELLGLSRPTLHSKIDKYNL